MQGPPGTGKSQTITNIIAEALAEGKKVLFVSEKMAALQVVYRRLQDAHLGDFCLPLHSYKANKKEILEQIGANLKLKQTRVKDAAIKNLEELLSIRQELNKYAEELHTLNPELNVSCYEVYGKLEEVNDVPAITFALEDPLSVSQTKLQTFLNLLKEYALSLERLHYHINNNPWDGLDIRVSGYEYNEQMRVKLEALNNSLRKCIEILSTISEVSVFSEQATYISMPEIADVIKKICDLPQIPQIWLGTFDFEKGIKSVTDAKNTYAKLFDLREAISKVFIDTIYHYNYTEWKDKLLAQANGFADLPFIRRNSGFFIKEAVTLHTHFTVLKNALIDARNTYKAINDKLGTDFSTNAYNRQIVVSLFELIRSNVILNKIWFSSDIGKTRNLIIEAQTITNDIKNAKEKLLSAWEPEILKFDYAPILLRYKTEYTSLFRVFKGQYKQDKKQILALSKTVLKKISDDAVVDLLTTLKHYDDKLNWLEENAFELERLLGNYYKGLDSDWDYIINAVGICSQIRDLLISEVSPRLLDIVSVEHTEEAAKLDVLLSELTTALITVKNEAASLKAEINIDSATFDAEEAINTIETYLCKLNEVSAQAEMIKPYLVMKMTAFLVIVLILGNLLLISGSMVGDLSDNYIAWFIVFAAIAMDCYFIYKIIQSVSESHEKKRLANATQKVNEIINRYFPSKIFSLQEAKKIVIDPSLVNKDVVLCVKEYKESISALLKRNSEVNKKLMSILSCNGYTTEPEKADYLISKLPEIEILKNESNELIEKISKNKIELLNEDGDLLLFLKSAFLSLLHSRKCVSNSLDISDVISRNMPNDLNLFKFKYAPPVLFVNEFYYCLFSNVILVFDRNGIFSTAIDPTSLSVTLNKQTERVLVSNSSAVRQEFTDTDSKLVRQGNTRTTWTHTRNDGLPDRRYSYNPRIEYRIDDYEYGIIVFSVANSSLTMKVSSQTAIAKFSTFSERYIRKCNNLHNPIPDLLLLLKCISDDEYTSLSNIVETFNRSALQRNYFCCQTNI